MRQKFLFILILFFLFSFPVYAGGSTINTSSTRVYSNPAPESEQKYQKRIEETSRNLVSNSEPKKVFFGIFDTWQKDLTWNLFSAFLGGMIGFGLVVLTEKLKAPSATIEALPDLVLPDGRKFLKVKVVISTREWIKKIFPWQNPASFAKVKGYLISYHNGKETILTTYTVKWDSKPEPWDYINNVPRYELLPATSEGENFLPTDEGTASILVKHPNESHFYLYEANYYVNRHQRQERKVRLKLIFTSSSAHAEKEFDVVNPGTSVSGFKLLEVS